MYSCLPFDYDYTSHSLFIIFIAFSWLMDLHIWFTFFWLRSVISKWAIDDQIPSFFRWHGGWFANGKSPSWIKPSFGEGNMFPTTTQRSQIQVRWPECFRFFRWFGGCLKKRDPLTWQPWKLEDSFKVLMLWVKTPKHQSIYLRLDC